MLSENIKKWVRETLELDSGEDQVDFVVEYPGEMAFGDYSTNVAMVCAKKEKKNPKELAENFVIKLNEKKIPEVEKITVAGPGFINFFLMPEVFAEVVAESVKDSADVGRSKKLKGQKILVEYTDPNPFKEFHIGHLMSNAIGEAISRIIEAEGARVSRLSYGSDVGLHVAKAIFIVLQQKEKISEIKNKSSKEQLEFWAASYVAGSTQYEENEKAKTEINNLNKIIFDKSDAEINALYDWGREVSILHFQQIFKLLGTKFDKNIWESEVADEALVVVKEGLEKKILEQSEGAVIFKGENYGLHTRVFVNSKGIPVYEAKELALAMKKIKEFSFDKSIVITGNEQNDYFKVLLKVMDLLKPEWANKTVHIGHGMLRFASGKMSSRKGNVITGVSLLADIKEMVMEKMEGREMSAEQKEKVAGEVAVGAIKFSILKQSAGKDIIFDFEKSVSFEGDSGPYLQYAVVRANSILKKAGAISPNAKMPENWQTTDLEKMFERFESVVSRSGVEYAPHYIVTYLVELASEFNSFYAHHKIIDETDPTSPYKLALTQSFANIMTAGLNLLGISVPEEM
jgi:arginyl-tRNA synthetase